MKPFHKKKSFKVLLCMTITFFLYWGIQQVGCFLYKCEIIYVWSHLIQNGIDDRMNKKLFMQSNDTFPWSKELYMIFEELEILFIYRCNLCGTVNSISSRHLDLMG